MKGKNIFLIGLILIGQSSFGYESNLRRERAHHSERPNQRRLNIHRPIYSRETVRGRFFHRFLEGTREEIDLNLLVIDNFYFFDRLSQIKAREDLELRDSLFNICKRLEIDLNSNISLEMFVNSLEARGTEEDKKLIQPFIDLVFRIYFENEFNYFTQNEEEKQLYEFLCAACLRIFPPNKKSETEEEKAYLQAHLYQLLLKLKEGTEADKKLYGSAISTFNKIRIKNKEKDF